ncbi:MAG: SH3 domain-containing protein [Leptospirales bacterium]|nr:SH3 domain-containing protein [Leptospirales bacterium]
MKKKILKSSLLVCLISFLFLSTGIINGAETDQSKEKYVATKSGLNLRSGPNKSSKVITLIPFGAKVTIVKSDGNEIFLDGRYGKWVNVKYGNNTGSVFSGFLCDFKPDTVIKAAADFYRDKYRMPGSYSQFKEFTHFKDSEVVIENIVDNYIVLRVPTTMMISFEPWYGDVVWEYDVKQKKFLEVFNMGHSVGIHIFYLNKDKYPDMIVSYGCCGNNEMDVYFGTKGGFRKNFYYDSNGYFCKIVGFCRDMEFAYNDVEHHSGKSTDTAMYFFRFNCNEMEFEQYAESKIIESYGAITSTDFKNMSVVIKDEKNSKDTSYKFYKPCLGEDTNQEFKKLQNDDYVSFEYVIIGGKKLIISIYKQRRY